MYSTFRASARKPPAPGRRKPHCLQACERCRKIRIKCDDQRPCQSCSAKGVRCRDSDTQDRNTRAAALGTRKTRRTSPDAATRKNQISQPITPKEADDDPQSSQPTSGHLLSPEADAPDSTSAHTANTSDGFLNHFHQTVMSLYPGSQTLDLSLTLSPYPLPDAATAALVLPPLDRATEERLLATSLESYQAVASIINHAWIWDHYNSLWSAEGPRANSPLVDILLALSMHQVLSLSDNTIGYMTQNDPPGYYYFERSQLGLLRSTDIPTIETVLGHMYAAVYMGNLHQSNKAHQLLAPAVRSAQLMGLPSKLNAAHSSEISAMTARAWLALQILDNTMSSAAGLPYLISSPSVVNSSKLSNDGGQENQLYYDGLSQVECLCQIAHLSSLIRDACTSINAVCHPSLTIPPSDDNYSAISYHTSVTSTVKACIKSVHEWARSLPGPLKTPAKKEDDPCFDPDCEMPVWLRRQRLLLRVCYHMAAMKLLRPYSSIPEEFERRNPTAAELSVACSKHAASLTATVQENLESNLFNILSRITACQWVAIIHLVGFSVTHPTNPQTANARKAATTAIANFTRLASHNVPQAKEALDKGIILCDVAESVVNKSLADLTGLLQAPAAVSLDSIPSDFTPNFTAATPEWFVNLGEDWPDVLLEPDTHIELPLANDRLQNT